MVITGRPSPRPGAPVLRAAPVAECAGLVLLLAGTFLPWLVSGAVSRNSYTTTALFRRLLDVDGVAGSALRVWPFVGVICTVAVALIVLGQVTPGSVFALAAASAGGTAAVVALVRGPSEVVRVSSTGPAVTLAGAAATLAAAVLCLSARHRMSGRPS